MFDQRGATLCAREGSASILLTPLLPPGPPATWLQMALPAHSAAVVASCRGAVSLWAVPFLFRVQTMLPVWAASALKHNQQAWLLGPAPPASLASLLLSPQTFSDFVPDWLVYK